MTRFFGYSLFALMLFSSPTAAADGCTPLLASSVGGFWHGFKAFWAGMFGSFGGVVGIVVLAGIAGIFIITRGKWLK